ncbi:DUF817 domain-containing protein [Demetria terragena]|uniref:DUF817 domain-containing protein n=1 Tax=Demetria terragena TaxID=63959 RepID=UPI0003601156|nr:DUF817 domain-containing protein [Demetria terragena]
MDRGLPYAFTQLLRFAWLEVRACSFAIVLVAAMAITVVVPLPIARYDALLLVGVLTSLAFWLLGLETGRELIAIAGFHVTGLVFEIVKVNLGSWTYPDPGVLTIMGVPLFSGFMYAAVGSYIVAAWRLFDLRLTSYRAVAVSLIGAGIYLNFFTHHWIIDLRWVLAVMLLAACWGTWVHFTVGTERYRMPLTLAFVLIGFFIWVAENLATLFAAYRYPDQGDGWTMVHVGKFGSWALLVVVSFAMVAAWKGSSLRELSHPDSASTD